MKINLRTNIRTLETTVMTVVKHSPEAWVLRKTEEDLVDVFPFPEKLSSDCFG